MRVYAARPMTAYYTDLDGRQLAALARHFPKATVLDPAELFESNEEWLAEWPGILDRLDLLVLWADADGMVGAGVLREVADAVAARLPVVCIDRHGLLRAFGGVWTGNDLVPPRRQLGRLVYGQVLDAGEVAGAAASHTSAAGMLGA